MAVTVGPVVGSQELFDIEIPTSALTQERRIGTKEGGDWIVLYQYSLCMFPN